MAYLPIALVIKSLERLTHKVGIFVKTVPHISKVGNEYHRIDFCHTADDGSVSIICEGVFGVTADDGTIRVGIASFREQRKKIGKSEEQVAYEALMM